MDNIENQIDDSKELVVIDYYDRIHKQTIKLEVTKEVAKFLKADEQKTRRNQNKYNYYNKSFDKVFNEQQPENEHYLLDEDSAVDAILEKRDLEQLAEAELEHQRTLIENSLCCLTDSQRQVVEMAYYQNITYSQIAEALNIDKSSVYARMKNAEKNIKNYIKNTQN